MSVRVGNLEDWFSHVAAHMSKVLFHAEKVSKNFLLCYVFLIMEADGHKQIDIKYYAVRIRTINGT